MKNNKTLTLFSARNRYDIDKMQKFLTIHHIDFTTTGSGYELVIGKDLRNYLQFLRLDGSFNIHVYGL